MQQMPDPAIDRDIPNLLRTLAGWYPRWWILSAFLSSLVIIVGLLMVYFGNYIPCPASAGLLCNFPGWHPVLQVAAIWACFLAIWLIVMLLGIGLIEVPGPGRDRQRVRFVRAMSEFGPVYPLILLYGGVALLAQVLMWLLDRTTPIAFALASIIIFVANCSFLHRRPARRQRFWLIVFGVIGVFTLILTLVYRRQSMAETPFFLAGVLLLVGGIAAVFWRPRATQATAQQIFDENIAQATSPLFLLRNLWPINGLFPNRPRTTN